jgi:hypothetical protein
MSGNLDRAKNEAQVFEKRTAQGVRARNDGNNIEASGLRGKLGASSNIGIALLFEPERQEQAFERFAGRLAQLNPPPDRMTFVIEGVGASELSIHRGSPKPATVPKCHAWFVNMQSGDLP